MAKFEMPPDMEAERIANIVNLTLAHLDQRYRDVAPVRRGVHPRSRLRHGHVQNMDDSKDFQVGVFAKPGQEFEADSLSNADIDPKKPDRVPAKILPAKTSWFMAAAAWP
jgi:hypothetical protein